MDTESLFGYLAAGVSPYHAAANTAALLRGAGFAPLQEQEKWSLQPGGRYYLTRNGSSVIAFTLPKKELTGWRLSAAHSDSPTFRVKPAQQKGEGSRLAVEGYGGLSLPGWLDRPLGAAGRVLVSRDGSLQPLLYNSGEPVCVIPSLCVHFDEQHGKGHTLQMKNELQPVWACQKPLLQLAAEKLGVEADRILDFDLTLYPCVKPQRVGDDLFCSPRIDDLECAWACLQGFLAAAEAEDETTGRVYCLLDNEEVGSSTRQGAKSDFLAQVLRRIHQKLGLDEDGAAAVLAQSLLLSADNGHGLHPNYPDKADPENPVYLGRGLLLKYSANQRYTTGGLTGALAAEIFQRAGAAFQRFTNRADLPGGSTLGNLLAHSVSIPMADIGAPQWAMHSCVETASLSDAESLLKALTAYYRARITCTGDGCYTVE